MFSRATGCSEPSVSVNSGQLPVVAMNHRTTLAGRHEEERVVVVDRRHPHLGRSGLRSQVGQHGLPSCGVRSSTDSGPASSPKSVVPLSLSPVKTDVNPIRPTIGRKLIAARSTRTPTMQPALFPAAGAGRACGCSWKTGRFLYQSGAFAGGCGIGGGSHPASPCGAPEAADAGRARRTPAGSCAGSPRTGRPATAPRPVLRPGQEPSQGGGGRGRSSRSPRGCRHTRAPAGDGPGRGW